MAAIMTPLVNQSAQALAENTVASLFPTAALIPAPKVAAAISLNPTVARRQISQGRFPMPIVKIGRLNYVPRPALVIYLSAQFAACGLAPEAEIREISQTTKRGRGRPRKEEGATA
ncbi:MAG: hypothetical protein EKK46_09450 [Rhodocyclaceae bacterium]|nr:MAG: hypothetical protein EKK46_09450 [Rhodocyclaceae bacterium]